MILLGTAFLIWWSERNNLSRWQFKGVLLLVALPYGIFWYWLSGTVKLNQIRKGRHQANKTKHLR